MLKDAMVYIILCGLFGALGFYGTLKWADQGAYCTNGACYVEVSK